MLLRIENFRNGEWALRGEGQVPAETTLDQVREQTERSALNDPSRALVDGALVYETKKLTRARAKALFRV